MTTVIVNLFKNVCASLSNELEQNINYLHGHPLEIVNKLSEMTKNPVASAGKYPLIALFQDFEEKNDITGFINIQAQIIIATITLPSYDAPKRYEVNFIPMLYPIYDELLERIARSGYFRESCVENIKHTKTDRLYWGRNGLFGNQANIFNDHIDAIELKLTLNVKK